MKFEGFQTVDFSPLNPSVPGFVYVVLWVCNGEERPFYVGQTKRIWGRLDDYYWAQFPACTDFRVGEVVKCLSSQGYRIIVKYKSCAEPLKEERALINQLAVEKWQLLNKFPAYDYHTANEDEERVALKRFVDKLIGSR